MTAKPVTSEMKASPQAKTVMGVPAPHLPPKVAHGSTAVPVPPVSPEVAKASITSETTVPRTFGSKTASGAIASGSTGMGVPPVGSKTGPQPAAPAAQVPQGDTAPTGVPIVDAGPYVPPAKGSFGSFSRAFEFMSQMLTLAKSNRALLKPLVYDLMITTPISIVLAILMGFVHTRGLGWTLLGVGTAMLYFVDYACNSLTASLMYDYATTGEARMQNAMPRVKKALPGIITFAAVSALLDLATTYARERDDVASRILVRVLRAIWTTATYVIMPALVIEGVSFGAAFGRSKQLMDQDPTGVGAGVVAMSITSYLAAIVIFPLAWFSLRYGSLIHPFVGGILFFTFVNLYWSVSGWLKIAYATCFYMWARECERTKTTEHALAPRPLRAALDAA
jgi:hypothetical protein